jgi:6-phosphogluconolactonase (cycloisomerase 2 family)
MKGLVLAALLFVGAYDDVGGVDGLDGAVVVAVSPDGWHAYVAGRDDDALAVFERVPATGGWSFVEAERDGRAGVDGLAGVRDVTISPDGFHVYAAGTDEDAIALFTRDPGSGALTFGGVVRDGAGGVDGLDEVWSVLVSPDGKHVYAAGRSDSAVARFDRDSGSGALSFAGVVVNGQGGVSGLDGARALALSPGGEHLYVGSAGATHGMAVLARNAGTGALSFVQALTDNQGGVDGLNLVRQVEVSSDGASVYTAALGDLAIGVFARHTTTGALSFVQKQGNAGAGSFDPVGVEVSSDGAFAYAATQLGNAVVAYTRDAATGALTFLERKNDDQGGVDGLSSAGRLALSADETQLLVTGTADDALAVFGRSPGTGALAFGSVVKDAPGMDFPASAVESADGAYVYVAAQDDNAVSVWRRDPASGALSFVEVEQNAVALRGTRYTATSPDGAHLYVASAFGDALAAFERDAASGELTFVEAEIDGQNGADGLNAATQLVVSPDGAFLYVSGQADASIGIFARDPLTGAVSYVGKATDNLGGVDGLAGVQGLTLSPDGDHLYAGGTTESAVAVLARDAGTGGLAFVEVERDGLGGVDGLGTVRALAVSPDGAHLYAAAFADQAVAVFARDPATGALTFLEVEKEGVGGVSGIDQASSVAVSADGAWVYVCGAASLAVFARDPATGTLDFVEVERDGVGGVTGLDGPARVTTSASGARVYVASRFSDTIAVFLPEPDAAPLALAAIVAWGGLRRRSARR